jgi:hypothetical protein
MPVESRHFLLNAHVAGRVLVLRQIAESLIGKLCVREIMRQTGEIMRQGKLCVRRDWYFQETVSKSTSSL